MLTKAFIKELPKDENNYFKVEVPIMEDNTGTEAIFDALLCSDPSNYNGYSVGDAVYVSFEDDKYDIAVIMGKLFVETPTDSTSYTLSNELKVTDFAYLPPVTRFGDYTAQDFINLYNNAGNLDFSRFVDKEELAKILEEYVRWINNERSEGDVFANKIMIMDGDEFDNLMEEYEEMSGRQKSKVDTTLYFLTSEASEYEADNIEGS